MTDTYCDNKVKN